jgi:hypothetical protein
MRNIFKNEIKTFERPSFDVLEANIKGILIELEDIGYSVSAKKFSTWVDKEFNDMIVISIKKQKYDTKLMTMDDPTCNALFEMLFEYVFQNDFAIREIVYTERIASEFVSAGVTNYYKFSNEYIRLNKDNSYDNFNSILSNKDLSTIVLRFVSKI